MDESDDRKPMSRASFGSEGSSGSKCGGGAESLTQDCIVWDESSNVDLRKLASPHFQTPVSSIETPLETGATKPVITTASDLSTNGCRRRQSLQDVSRRLTKSSIDHRTNIRSYVPENEMDNLFSRLAQEKDLSSDMPSNESLSSSSSQPTPRQRNTVTFPPNPVTATHDENASTTVLQPSKSRKRQRREEALRMIHMKASNPSLDRENASNVHSVNDGTSHQGEDDGTDDFARLLQQVKTPSPHVQTANTMEHISTPTFATSAQQLPARPQLQGNPVSDAPPRVSNLSPVAKVAPSSSCVVTQAVQENDDDEFGDFNISLDDLAKVDSLVEQVTQDQDNKRLDLSPVPRPKVRDESPLKDHFDDFPDIDFEALDKSIELHQFDRCPTESIVPPQNNRHVQPASELSCLTFSRYKVVHVDQDVSTFTKTLSVAKWQTSMLQDNVVQKAIHKQDSRTTFVTPEWNVDGLIYLRGEWYHTRLTKGDVIHVCSLYGQFRTDRLPLMVDSVSADDDLVLIVHPDMLLTPTGICETVSCTRRAILKQRLGSSGLTSKFPLFGTFRHELFQAMMKSKDFSREFAHTLIPDIVRRNAEGLLACCVSSKEAEMELIQVIPQIQAFAKQFTSFGGTHGSQDVIALMEKNGVHIPKRFVVDEIETVEEPVISPELGLKGNVDVIVQARLANADLSDPRSETALVSIELKTGHNQSTQNAHMAQLSLYTLMVQSRYGTKVAGAPVSVLGAGKDAVLLYINNESLRVVHTAPFLHEIKSLISMRNLYAIEATRASRPRGVVLVYQKGEDTSQEVPKVVLVDPIPAALPDVLGNSHPCGKCYANRECMLYAAASENKVVDSNSNFLVSTTHRELFQRLTSHLGKEDLDFFLKWDRLIDLEADAASSLVAETWLLDSYSREVETSRCISRLRFDPDTSIDGGQVATISFYRDLASGSQTPFDNLAFERGCHVIVSCDSTTLDGSNVNDVRQKKMSYKHIVRGFIECVLPSQVKVNASIDDLRRMKRIPTLDNGLFRIDRDDISSGVGILRRNMINFFTKDIADQNPSEVPAQNPQRGTWLRDMVVRLRAPLFNQALKRNVFSMESESSESLCSSYPGCALSDLARECDALNSDQRHAVEKVMTAEDYCLIQGLPGTGKTQTVAFVARLLAAHGKRVLVTSYTHNAVDNVMLKLRGTGLGEMNGSRTSPAVVRIGQASSCHPGVSDILATNVAKRLESMSGNVVNEPCAETLRQAVSSARIVGVTSLSIPRSPLLVGQHFDIVIVDEAGQISQPAIVGALLAADSFILVGDHMQLPPLVISELAEKGGYGVSMLKYLADEHPTAIAQLTLQYRMNEEICQLSNDIAYQGALKCANDVVRNQTLPLSHFPSGLYNVELSWKRHFLVQAIDPASPVMFINTDEINGCPRLLERTTGRNEGGSIVNDAEAQLVEIVAQSFISCGMDASDIGIICPFRAQLRLLSDRSILHDLKGVGLELSTIDRYQGRDKSTVILSFVRSNVKGKVGRLLEDFRRLNVAVTRAKCKLVMIGSFSTLHTGSATLQPSLTRLKEHNRVLSVPPDFFSDS